jgi:hypothetical protein
MKSPNTAQAQAAARPAFDYGEAFSRNIGVVSSEEQQSLRHKHVAIPGCGGVGSLHALALARAGVGRFTLADFDRYEVANFNRQFGARCSTLQRPKVEVVADEIRDINPEAEVRIFREGVQPGNIDEFLETVDLVIDSLDFFAFHSRDLLFPAAQRRGIPLVTAAPLGFSCALLIFTGRSMSYEKYFGFRAEDSPRRRALKFAMGLAPKAMQRVYMDPTRVDLDHGRGPSHVTGVLLCAAMATAETLRILLGRGRTRAVPHFQQFDTYRGKFGRGYLWLGSANPWQRLKLWLVMRFLFKEKKGD